VNQAKSDTPPEVHADGSYVDFCCRRGLLPPIIDELIDLTTMQPFKVVLGWPVTPIPASLIPAGTPASFANCYTQMFILRSSNPESRMSLEGQKSALPPKGGYRN
jgi:hypothetical protein